MIRGEISSAGSLDALYVNAEFYPGVLFLGRSGPVDFGLGAGLLFRRDDFLREVGWERVGKALADDFVLGQKLGPVRLERHDFVDPAGGWELGHGTAALPALEPDRLVEPAAGSAARIAIMPVAGWAFLGCISLREPDCVVGAGCDDASGCDLWCDFMPSRGVRMAGAKSASQRVLEPLATGGLGGLLASMASKLARGALVEATTKVKMS